MLLNEAPRTTNAAHGAKGEYFQMKYRDKDPIDVVVWVEVGAPHNQSNAQHKAKKKLERSSRAEFHLLH